ncbi:DDT domain-containing protein PTM-like isoform X1 [Salvia splendens]|uniref:DDT domain-containing protein PTM-like isoform X1 n=1 Tax=Salvia splendens TaxID=180675 RepID=UPI001C26CFC0|nr:DDT domain-containing protein PTM-like isoform X1 [Salvia splendens]
MESAMPEPPKRRGRKRKNRDLESTEGRDGKRIMSTRSLRLVGRYVQKNFQGSGLFLGKIMSYDLGLYRVNYEDGDFEDLDSGEVKVILVEECDLNGEWSEKKEKLDKLLLIKDVNGKVSKVENTLEPENVNQVDSSLSSDQRNGEAATDFIAENHDDGNSNADADSSNDSCEDTRDQDNSIDMEEPLVPPPELPQSSGHIGVPEAYVSHLLSVHSFLRSFSVPLFLYPFGLDDFVGALNCSVANTLLDSIHVAMLHVLKRHIERLSSEGSELALKCMRCLDWNLLDNLTWPVYLVHYLIVMNPKNGPDWKDFYVHSLERDYYTLSAGRKLIVLQILCDFILDAEELRAEMDMREESEVGIDMDTSTVVKPTGASRRHPRASGFKDREQDAYEMKSSLDRHSIQVGRSESYADDDANGDECRICGMDGLLLCCDGCPLSYHSRCVGLNKMHMPEGSWYCPECKIKATEPQILQGTTLRGGYNFGVDPYGQVFVATCDHLLVLKASVDSEICLRYYNRRDIPRALHALCSKAEHVAIYSEICMGVVQYWQLPEEIVPLNKMTEVGVQLTNEIESGVCTDHVDNLLDDSIAKTTEIENTGSCISTSAADTTVSSLMNCVHEPAQCVNTSDKVAKPIQLGNTDFAKEQSGIVVNTNGPTSYSGLMGQPTDTKDLSQQSTSNVTEVVAHSTRNQSNYYSGPSSYVSQEAKTSNSFLELKNRVDKLLYQNSCDGCSYMGSSFKTSGYINNYLHGDFAASAAANLAILSSEENHVPDRSSYNRRKVMSENVLLHVKAFASAYMQFFWPNSEKKLVEIPRERCSWCFYCKANVVSKRGCLLNAAASNANRGAIKVLAGVRSMKKDGRLPGVATYIMFMEESLGGLLIGPFRSDTFRKRWRKEVEQATDCIAIKLLLRELEQNVHPIALSGDWIKLVDNGSTQSSTTQIAANAAGSTQKRRPGRRGRKPSAVVEVATDDCQDTSTDFTWWRGGTLSKLMFQRCVLPSSMVRKAARHAGGSKKIPGINYVDGYETPKISRQLIWRSAVEMSRNMAQLALQVRCLDFHVRWNDLIRPDQNRPDGKGPDAEASAFRNAFICEKKSLGNEVRYCIDFGNQKHLPSRVLKSVLEVEQIPVDGKERYWFAEIRIPLYLIKEYEEQTEKNNPLDMPKLQRRQWKASRENIFSYLARKQEIITRSNCSSCHQDVLYRDAVKCSSCQGFYHQHCTVSSTVQKSEEGQFFITCKSCSDAQALAQVQNSYGSPTSPLLLQGQDMLNGVTASRSEHLVGYKRPSESVGVKDYSSEIKSINTSANKKKSNNKNWGFIWRKGYGEDTGMDFRLKNIIMRGNPDMDMTNPVCRLCNLPYNADLMYICCESCKHWVHADAVELDESNVYRLAGFKCSRCRRIKNPVCPYKPLDDKVESKAPKLERYEMDSNSPFLGHHMEERSAYSAIPMQEEVGRVVADVPPVLSPSSESTGMMNVDYGWNNSNVPRSGSNKLPVRRQVKQVNDAYSPYPFEANVLNSSGKLPVRRHIKSENNPVNYPAVNPHQVETPNLFETKAESSGVDSLSSEVNWDVSNGSFDDGISLDYDGLGFDDMDFEPQTYFSFHELLASDDGSRASGNAPSGDVMQNLESASTLPENEMLDISYDDYEDPIISIGTEMEIVPCNICSHTEPCPDLSCQLCGMWIHNHCSPWVEREPSSWEENWRCGNCREWR